MESTKKLLLIDLDDERRGTRVDILQRAGYEVDVRSTYIEAHRLSDEGTFDLVVIALHFRPDEAIPYSDELSRNNPDLPILLLTDWGVFVPRGTLSKNLDAGSPISLITTIATMLAGSIHVREITADMAAG